MSLSILAAAVLLAAADSARDSTSIPFVAAAPAGVTVARVTAARDTTRRQAPVIEYSDWYGRRLLIHQIGSWAMFPVFAGEYVLGQKLIDGNASSSTRNAHTALATGLGALFVTNTVTGAWNLYDSRKDPAGRTRRIVHTTLMLAADAGFVATGMLAGDASEGNESEGGGSQGGSGGANQHRSAALVSMGIATVGTVMMWLWKD